MIALGYMMEEFLLIISSFPVIIYTVLLGVMVVLALLTVIGLVDIEGPEFDFDLDGDTDYAVDTPTAEGLAGFMLSWGLTGVPITIVFTILTLNAWFFSYYSVYYLFDYVPAGILEIAAGVAVLVGSFYVALPLTALLIKPLKPLFKKAFAISNKHILGQIAVIRSSKVTATFGEATFDDRGAGLLLKVRNKDENTLKKGDRVALLSYDNSNGTYIVIPEIEFTH